MRAILFAGLTFLYAPIIILVVYSFTSSKLVTVWAGFSTQWYSALFNNKAMMEAATVSLQVAVISASIACVLGTMASLALRDSFKGKRLFEAGLAAPLILPEVILALSLMLFFTGLGVDKGIFTIILAHSTFTLCFVTLVVSARLKSLDKTLEEAARDLGATPFQAFMRVTLPQILPAIIAGWLLAFTLSLDDLIIASFTSGPGATTLPMRIYSQARLGITPEMNALSTLILGAVTTLVITASLLMNMARPVDVKLRP
jgi:putrescine transport system permease protein